MRAGLLAALMAALVLAAPAQAQPVSDIEAEAFAAMLEDQLQRNHGSVTDYSFTLVSSDFRIPVWVHEDAGEWVVDVPNEPAVAELVSAAVIWPAFHSLGAGEGEDEMEEGWGMGLNRETVDGRPMRVLSIWWAGAGPVPVEMPDSFRVYVDESSYQIGRVSFGGAVPTEEADMFGGSARVEAVLEMTDYQTENGLTLPRSLRMVMRMEPGLNAKEMQSMREELQQGLEIMREQATPESAEMLYVVEMTYQMIFGGGMDVPMRVEEVRVNPGRPSWLRTRSPDKS